MVYKADMHFSKMFKLSQKTGSLHPPPLGKCHNSSKKVPQTICIQVGPRGTTDRPTTPGQTLKPLAAALDLAVHTMGLPQGSFSMLFPRESLKAPLGFCYRLFRV